MRRATSTAARLLAQAATGKAISHGLPAADSLLLRRTAGAVSNGAFQIGKQFQQFPFAASFASEASPSSSSSESDDEEYWSPSIIYPPPEAKVGEPAPFFKGTAVVDGEFKQISLADYRGKFVVLFFYPKDFTFVCPTEIVAFSDRAKEFEALGVQLIAASTDTQETHLAWIKTPRNRGGLGYMQIPILADTTKEIAARYGVLIERAGVALRGLFIINPEGVLEQATINNLPVGRSVDETLRLVQAIQFVREHGEVCPANWKPGAKSMIADPEKSQEYFSSLESGGEEAIGAALTPITSKKEYEAAINSPKAVIDFYAPWCGKCRQISPFVDELAAKHKDVQFFKFDTTDERLEKLAVELGVKALPAFRFYKNGQEAGAAVTGYKKRPLQQAVEAL